MVTSPGGLSGAMNKFFLDKIRRLRASVPPVQTDPLIKMKEAMRSRRSTFRLKAVMVRDVLKVIKSLKNSTATGTDFNLIHLQSYTPQSTWLQAWSQHCHSSNTVV